MALLSVNFFLLQFNIRELCLHCYVSSLECYVWIGKQNQHKMYCNTRILIKLYLMESNLLWCLYLEIPTKGQSWQKSLLPSIDTFYSYILSASQSPNPSLPQVSSAIFHYIVDHPLAPTVFTPLIGPLCQYISSILRSFSHILICTHILADERLTSSWHKVLPCPVP